MKTPIPAYTQRSRLPRNWREEIERNYRSGRRAVLVVHHHHGPNYWDGSTLPELLSSALEILKGRVRDDFWTDLDSIRDINPIQSIKEAIEKSDAWASLHLILTNGDSGDDDAELQWLL